MTFATLKTGIDGLDGILGGGIRYPDDAAAFACIAGGPGTGKTLLALEMVVRAWLTAEDGTFLYYSVEHSPDSIEKKLAFDFGFFGVDFDADVSIISLSIGKSLLPSDVQLPLRLEPSAPPAVAAQPRHR